MARASRCRSPRTDDRVLGPTHKLRWSYACGKAVDECLAQAYWEQQRLPVTTVRCFNTCGPRQSGDYGMVIPNMVLRALRNEPIPGLRRRHAIALHSRR